FALARYGTAQHHICDIRAGNQQHESYGRHHEQKDQADTSTVVVFVERLDRYADVFVLRILCRKTAGNPVHIHVCLEDDCLWLEHSKERESPARALLELRSGHQGSPHIYIRGEFEAL